MKTLKDKVGKPIGHRDDEHGRGRQVKELNYMWRARGDTTPVQKVTYVTKVADQTCCRSVITNSNGTGGSHRARGGRNSAACRVGLA